MTIKHEKTRFNDPFSFIKKYKASSCIINTYSGVKNKDQKLLVCAITKDDGYISSMSGWKLRIKNYDPISKSYVHIFTRFVPNKVKRLNKLQKFIKRIKEVIKSWKNTH